MAWLVIALGGVFATVTTFYCFTTHLSLFHWVQGIALFTFPFVLFGVIILQPTQRGLAIAVGVTLVILGAMVAVACTGLVTGTVWVPGKGRKAPAYYVVQRDANPAEFWFIEAFYVGFPAYAVYKLGAGRKKS